MAEVIGQTNFSGDWRPWIDGQIFKDALTRDRDNHISWQFNVALWVAENYAYWNYPWYFSWNLDGYTWYDILVKDWTSGNISWQWKYMTDVSSHFTGTKSVGGTQTWVPLTCWFHDNSGHWGPERYFNVGIPQATAPGSLTLGSSTSMDTDGNISAIIKANCGGTGAYAHYTQWRIQWGKSSYNENERTVAASGWDNGSFTYTLNNLAEKTTYRYRITVWNSAGLTSSREGTFTTPEYISGNVITSEKESESEIWVVKPNGSKARVYEIERIEPSGSTVSIGDNENLTPIGV